MSYRKKKGFGKGTFMEAKMLLSPAYQSLGVRGSLGKGFSVSTASIHILNALLLKRQFYKRKKKKKYERVDDNLLKFRRSYTRLFNYCIFNNINKVKQSVRLNFVTKYIT